MTSDAENDQQPSSNDDDPQQESRFVAEEENLSSCPTPPPADPMLVHSINTPQSFSSSSSAPSSAHTSYEDQARCYQHWTLSYLSPLLKLGASKVLVVDDLGRPSREDGADVVHDVVIRAWEDEIRRADAATRKLREMEARRRENRVATAAGSKRRWWWHRARRPDGEAAEQALQVDTDAGATSAVAVAVAEGNGPHATAAARPPPKPKPKVIHPSLSRAIFNAFGKWRIFYAVVLMYISALIAFVPIILLNDLVKYFEALNAGRTYDGWAHPWAEAVGLGLFPLLASLLQTRHMVIMQHCAVFARTGCSTLLFRKALRVSPTGRARTNTGQVVNMMSVDTNVIMRFIQLAGMTLVTPLQIVISLVLIYNQVGNATWVGVGFLFALLPVNAAIFAAVAKLRRRVLKHQDARVKMINDLLTGIRIIKFYAWEKPFLGEVGNVREEELKALTTLTLVMLVGFTAILFAAPIIQIILVFMTYVLTEEGALSASVAFTTVALFNMMRFPFAILPMGFLQWIQAQIGINRMQKYLELPELTTYVVDGKDPDREDEQDAGSISMRFCSFAWTDGSEDSTKPLFEDVDAKKKTRKRSSLVQRGSMRKSSIFRRASVSNRNSRTTSVTNGASLEDIESEVSSAEPFVLRDISCSIKAGSLCCVVGEVGCGKSSFLTAILGEMEPLNGSSKVYIPRGEQGRNAVNFAAFCSQTPFVVNATLRDNIVFGRAFDQARYDTILQACALLDDIAVLPAGDLTEIGERGVGLSGGQKARVCLARALYSRDTSLLLLDDPLSAVDAHVGEHLFSEAIAGDLLATATRVLVTHHIQFLPRCDWVIVMEDGRIKHQGTYEDLIDQGVSFVGAVAASSVTVDDSCPKEDGAETMTDTKAHVETDALHSETDISLKAKPHADVADAGSVTIEDSKEHALMTEEGREEGAVSKKDYVVYTKAGGLFLATLFIIAQAAAKAFEIGSSFWLAKWADDTVNAYVVNEPLTDAETIYYLNIYAVFGLLGVACLIARGYALAYHRLRSSRRLHADMLASILRAPISFFDVTPMGRVLNRFSHDMDKIDLELGHVISQGANVTFAVLGALGAMAAATKGTFLIILVPLGWIYYKIQVWFRKTSTELGRLFSLSKSPIFADFSQTLAGVLVLRAYGEQGRRFDKVRGDFDKNNICYILQQLSFLWIALRLDVLGGIISFFVAAVAVGTASTSASIPAGWLGLALTYSIEIVTYLKHGVRMVATLEADFSSVERVLEFANDIEAEAADVREDDPKADKWPSEGAIEVSNMSMRYRQGPLVLKNLSFSVAGGEKIGVIGRTASGKSSLMIALLRIVEIEDDGGKILVDGIDISTLGTSALRSGISIIPQESVLFANTVRYNVDPFRQATDDEIWQALEKVKLATVIASMPEGLETQVTEGGDNFSQGQRQLLCIARSILRRPRILIMDEATASIDNATDADIQEMIRENFADATILTIAHRINTIMDSDRILVLDDGKIVEFDTPSTLLSKQEGMFKALVKREGESRRNSSTQREP